MITFLSNVGFATFGGLSLLFGSYKDIFMLADAAAPAYGDGKLIRNRKIRRGHQHCYP
jgi:hypothetical protein